mmetsp:Transcript_78255/g.198929  ORF Transcript_78255/g.198929 Transcript_78255/m.198929 type:complete len:234 (+) Transcript_78255:662-1363(+)
MCVAGRGATCNRWPIRSARVRYKSAPVMDMMTSPDIILTTSSKPCGGGGTASSWGRAGGGASASAPGAATSALAPVGDLGLAGLRTGEKPRPEDEPIAALRAGPFNFQSMSRSMASLGNRAKLTPNTCWISNFKTWRCPEPATDVLGEVADADADVEPVARGEIVWGEEARKGLAEPGAEGLGDGDFCRAASPTTPPPPVSAPAAAPPRTGRDAGATRGPRWMWKPCPPPAPR